MSKLWLVAVTTYRRQLRSGTFLMITFGMPLLMIVAGAIPLLRELAGGDARVGYVDETGRLATVAQVTSEGITLTLTQYADQGAAGDAFERGDVSGYVVVPAGYFSGERVRYYGTEAPGARQAGAVAAFLRQASVPGRPDWVTQRLAEPAGVTYVSLDRGLELSEGPAVLVYAGLPAVLALLFALAVFTGASQLGSVMVREKDQRALEMVITSLAPRELVGGKVLGMTLLSLTQLALWLTAGVGALLLALSNGPGFGSLVIPWRACLWGVLLGIPGYFLYATLAAGLGIIAGDAQQARQLAGVLGFVGMAPLWLTGMVVQSPNAPLVVALTIFPLTAPMFGLLRMAFAEVPTWQLVAGLVLILVGLAAGIWGVARIFRAAMLLYGQRVRPKQILRALRKA